MLRTKKAILGLALISALIGELESGVQVCFNFGNSTPSFVLDSDPLSGATFLKETCSCDNSFQTGARSCDSKDIVLYNQYVKEIERPTDAVVCCQKSSKVYADLDREVSDKEKMKTLSETCEVEKVGGNIKKKFYTIDPVTKWRHICHCSHGSTDTVCARLPGTPGKPCFMGCLSRMAKIRREKKISCCLAPISNSRMHRLFG